MLFCAGEDLAPASPSLISKASSSQLTRDAEGYSTQESSSWKQRTKNAARAQNFEVTKRIPLVVKASVEPGQKRRKGGWRAGAWELGLELGPRYAPSYRLTPLLSCTGKPSLSSLLDPDNVHCRMKYNPECGGPCLLYFPYLTLKCNKAS